MRSEKLVRNVRRFIVLCIGGTVLLFGVLLLFLPGPAIIVIPLGLVILASEFVWAKKLLEKVREKVKK